MDIDMVEESKDEPHQDHMIEAFMEGTNQCVYCRKVITRQEEAASQVNMLLSTECFHQFHIPCFTRYAKDQMLKPKPNSRELEFCEPQCGQCGKTIEQ